MLCGVTLDQFSDLEKDEVRGKVLGLKLDITMKKNKPEWPSNIYLNKNLIQEINLHVKVK